MIHGMKSRIIGLTGSIATGKSTVSNYLLNKGYVIIDADKIAHELMEKGKINYNNIVKYFGKEILDENEEIDRKKLGNIVFSNQEKLHKLNNLTHPNIFNKIDEQISQTKEKVIFLDIPLLIEFIDNRKWNIDIDEIWLVYTNYETQIKRLIERNNYSQSEAEKRINAQMNIDEKLEYADFVLYNDKDLDYLYEQIDERLKIYESN